MWPGLRGSQTLEHLSTAGSCRRAEDGVRVQRAGDRIYPGAQDVGSSAAGPPPTHREMIVLKLVGRLGGSCGWEYREAFYERLGCGSVGEGLLHGSPQWTLVKRDSLWS